MDNHKTKIGKNVIETLTLGMYEDSRFIYREYIQNSADQIDIAIKQSLLKPGEGKIYIGIDKAKKEVVIEDNATGIEQSNVVFLLKNIAESKKVKGESKGFRGIGRLGGLGYCDTLIFETSFSGENVKTVMIWDAKKLKEIINNHHYKEDASDVIDAVTEFSFEKEEIDKHYFRVTLQNVLKEELIEKRKIEDYLAMVAPVPYDKGFIFREKIYEFTRTNNIKHDEYCIFVNTDQIYKPYTTTIYKDVNGQKQSSGDEIFDIIFVQDNDKEGNLVYWGWYGISKFEGVIDDINPAKGIRLRKENIQVGTKHTLLKFFREKERGNYYFIGEIHAYHKDIVPNARRDYFLDSDKTKEFEKKLTSYFHCELNRVYNKASKFRSDVRKIHEFNKITDQIDQKEVINKEERAEFEKLIEKKEKEAKEARTRLIKAKEEIGDSDNDPIRKIFNRVVEDEKIEIKDVKLTENDNKIKYRTDKLSKLTKEQRKFLSKVYQIISNVLDKKLSDSLISKIEEEFK